MIDRYIESQKGKSFSWGITDCFIFCIGWADQLNGSNLLDEYRYSSAREAVEIMRSHGCSASWELFDRHFHRTEQPEPGDIVAIDVQGVENIGVCGLLTERGIFSVSNRGVAFVDAPIIHAWSVE